MTRRLRVAYLIPVFPEIHNTFILDQITGLIDRGLEVDLYPVAVGSYDKAHEEVRSYRLRERVRHIEVPEDRVLRLTRFVSELAKPRSWTRAVLGELNPSRGTRAMSLVPAYTALSFAANEPYDVVHVAFGNLSPLAERILTNDRARTGLVVSFRGADTTSYLRKVPDAYDRVFARGALALPVSVDLQKRLLAAGSAPERTIIHRDGVDLKRFAFEERRREPGEPTRMLFVGRFVEKKGVADALRAFATVAHGAGEERSGAQFTLVGSGPLEEELRRLAAELGVADRLRFTGPLDSKAVVKEMAAAHLFIAPSVTAATGDMEGVPSVIKEAMASGLPVLSTRHGGIPELVEDEVSGYLVEEHDVAALTERLSRLIDQPESWPVLGRAGRAKVEAEYDVDRLNDRLVEHYESVLKT